MLLARHEQSQRKIMADHGQFETPHDTDAVQSLTFFALTHRFYRSWGSNELGSSFFKHDGFHLNRDCGPCMPL